MPRSHWQMKAQLDRIDLAQRAIQSSVAELSRLVGHIDASQSRSAQMESIIMSQLDDLKAAAADLKTSADKEIAKLAEMETKLANSGVADNPEVAAVIAGIKSVSANLNTASDGIDAALNPPAAAAGATS